MILRIAIDDGAKTSLDSFYRYPQNRSFLDSVYIWIQQLCLLCSDKLSLFSINHNASIELTKPSSDITCRVSGFGLLGKQPTVYGSQINSTKLDLSLSHESNTTLPKASLQPVSYQRIGIKFSERNQPLRILLEYCCMRN